MIGYDDFIVGYTLLDSKLLKAEKIFIEIL